MEIVLKREKFIAKVPFQDILFVLKAEFLGWFVPVSKTHQPQTKIFSLIHNQKTEREFKENSPLTMGFPYDSQSLI